MTTFWNMLYRKNINAVLPLEWVIKMFIIGSLEKFFGASQLVDV